MNEQNEVFTQIVPNILYWFFNLHILPDPSYFIFFAINFFHKNTEYIDPKSHKYTIPMPKDTKNTNQKTKYTKQNVKNTNQNTKYTKQNTKYTGTQFVANLCTF